MSQSKPSASTTARRTFLQHTSTVLLAGLALPARASAPSALEKPQTITPWFVKDVPASPAPAPGVSTPKQVRSGPPLWSPHERMTHWARQTMQLVVKYQQNPLRAARAMAYVQVAMHDAWVHASSLVADAATAELAAHRAASLLAEQLYALETPGQFEAQFTVLTAHLRNSAAQDALALHVGHAVAEALMARSLRDGAGRAWPVKERPSPFPGMWQPAPPMNAVNPVEGYAPHWLTWLQPDSWRYVPPTAHRPGSAEHATEAREVLAVKQQLTEHQRQVAQHWHLDAGSVTPAGIWMQIALQQLQTSTSTDDGKSGHVMTQTLPVLAALSVSMLDAFVACWQVKLRDWSERPITAVRRDIDPAFEPLLVTPGFPSYVSGHATVSAAAATVLGAFWPEQRTRLLAMADEAAVSRLWGGIHFRSDNDEGLRLGRVVGDAVVARLRTG
jgi:PAP2 superfamily